jgi:hypothetical protein
MARESSLWKWLLNGKDAFTDDLLHMTRIENLVDEGTPDVEGCLDGDAFWIELKSNARPKRETTRCIEPRDIRPQQEPWLKRRWNAGGNAWMLIQIGEGHNAKRYLVPGNRVWQVPNRTELELAKISLPVTARTASGVLILAATHRSKQS